MRLGRSLRAGVEGEPLARDPESNKCGRLSALFYISCSSPPHFDFPIKQPRDLPVFPSKDTFKTSSPSTTSKRANQSNQSSQPAFLPEPVFYHQRIPALLSRNLIFYLPSAANFRKPSTSLHPITTPSNYSSLLITPLLSHYQSQQCASFPPAPTKTNTTPPLASCAKFIMNVPLRP